MYAFIVPAGVAIITFFYFVLGPIFVYLQDHKGFRKYPAINALAGITDIGFMWEAHKGFRSQRLAELHQKHPVIRIGPNSLSFIGVQAIKVPSHQITSFLPPY